MSLACNRDSTERLIALIDLFHGMWNTQNVSGVLDCFTEDAVVTIVSPQHHSSVLYRGQHQLRAFVRQTITGCVIRARSHHVVDDRVIWMATVANDHLRQVGVEEVRNRNEAVIREGKTTAYTVTMSPETVAELDAATGRGGVSSTSRSLVLPRQIGEIDWEIGRERGTEVGPVAGVAPVAGARVDRVLRPELLEDLTPGGTGVQDPVQAGEEALAVAPILPNVLPVASRSCVRTGHAAHRA